MINRIEKTFEKLKADGDKALVSFITAGDPNMEKSEQILCDLPKYGVDIIEVGIPFSDPMADGPTIQKSSNRAISAGSNLSKGTNILSFLMSITSIQKIFSFNGNITASLFLLLRIGSTPITLNFSPLR